MYVLLWLNVSRWERDVVGGMHMGIDSVSPCNPKLVISYRAHHTCGSGMHPTLYRHYGMGDLPQAHPAMVYYTQHSFQMR